MPAETTRGSDVARLVAVAVSAVLATAGAFFGSGAAGGQRVEEAAGGALAADATLIAPAGPAFSIWTVVYLGLFAYAVWQFLPAQRTAPRQRRLGIPIAASMLLNAAWILSVQADLIWLSVVVIVVLLAVLAFAFRVAAGSASSGALDAVITDGTVGLYLGWVCVATAANVTAALVAWGFDGWGIAPEAWALAVLAVATAVGVATAMSSRGRIAPALAIAWGLAWIAVGRFAGEPHSAVVGSAAIAGAVVVVAATVIARAVPGASRAGARRGARGDAGPLRV